MVGDLEAAANAPLMRLGDRLGLYRAIAEAGPLGSAEPAARTGTAERFFRTGHRENLVQDWLPEMDGLVGKLQRGADDAVHAGVAQPGRGAGARGASRRDAPARGGDGAEVVTERGFTRFRRATATPFNLILEAPP